MGTESSGAANGQWRHDTPTDELRVVRKPLRKIDARNKVTGLTQFADDLEMPRMLHMKLLRSTKAHALIKRIVGIGLAYRPEWRMFEP